MADKFELDTKNMDSTIQSISDLARQTEELRGNFQEVLTSATYGWYGNGRTTFDKETHKLMQQFTDVSQMLYEIAEDLYTAAEAYYEADMQLAKAVDGKQNRY